MFFLFLLAAFLFLIVPILAMVSFKRTRRILRRLDKLEHQFALLQSSLPAEQLAITRSTAARAAPTRAAFTPEAVAKGAVVKEAVVKEAVVKEAVVKEAVAKGAVVEAELVPARQRPASRERVPSPVAAPPRGLPAAAATPTTPAQRSAARTAEAERWAAAWSAAGQPDGKQPVQPSRSELAAEPEPEPVGTVPSLPPKDRLLSASDLEMLIGGNWLNRLGVLLILIGLVIFLGYSLTQLGPAGRIAIGFLVSLAMLGLGLVYQQRPHFQLFARGLLGGGWAGVYFTTYAMHAIAASRVISDPAVAAVLLCLVPAGMIAHAFWRNSTMGSLLAFLYGVLTILLVSQTEIATLAVLPLLAALLVLSYRERRWQAPPIAAVALYGAYCWTFALSSFPYPTFALVPFAAWLVLELYDAAESLRLRRTAGGELSTDAALEEARRVLAPLNAAGLLASVYFVAPASEFVSTYGFGLAAAVYALGAAARLSALPPAPEDEATPLLRRLVEGGYELSATLAAVLAGFFMWQRFSSSLSLTTGLLFEAMFLFLLGLGLKQKYLRLLASVAFTLTTCRLLTHLATSDSGVILASLVLSAPTRLALVAAVLLLVLRSFIRLDSPSGRLLLEWSYASQAALLLTTVLAMEAPPAVIGVSLLVLAGSLLGVGSARRLIDVRCGAYLAGAVGLAITLGINGLLWPAAWRAASENVLAWMWLGPATLLLAAAAGAAFRTDFVSDEKTGLLHATVAGGVTFAAFYIWHASPAVLVATLWAILGLSLVEAALRRPRLQLLRNYGVLLALAAFGRLFLVNFVNPGVTLGLSHRILTVLPITLLMYYLSVRLVVPGGRAGTRSSGWLSELFVHLGTILAVLLIRFEFGRVVAVLGWSAYMAALYYVGLRYNRQTLRHQALLLAGLTFARVWATNFFIPESLAGAFGRVVTGACVAAGFFVAQAVAHGVGVRTDEQDRLPRRVPDEFARSLFGVAGGLVLAILLYYEVSGRLLTVAWGFEGAVLLVVGLLLQDRVLRVFSLGLLSVCVAKAFAYDLASLATPYRILSFVILGALLVAASWFYTHFRARIAARHGHMAGT